MPKPRLILSCVANAHATSGERIAEFSFPEAADGRGNLPGGLLSLRYREGAPPLVSLYRVEGCEVVAPAMAHNPRYVAYALAHGRTVDSMLEHDAKAWPGGKMAGFILWNTARLREFGKAHPEAFVPSGLGATLSDAGHPAYDAWLFAWVAARADRLAEAEEIRLARVEQHSAPETAAAEMGLEPGEFERSKLAGYDVEPHGFGAGWFSRAPDGEGFGEIHLTERAAWEACDRHRMFGEPEMIAESPPCERFAKPEGGR
jgi:hypothetical protein